MENQVPESVKAKRSNELIELGRRKQAEYEETLMGTVQEVLIEEEILHEGERYQTGFTMEYVKIRQKSEKNQINQIINVEIESHLQIIH